jgi:cystathionine beta-synthase
VGEVMRAKTGAMPDLVHTHPTETVAEAINILKEYGVSQMPVVRAEPPVMSAEVAGSVSERALLDALFAGTAKLADQVDAHMSPPLPMIGATEGVGEAIAALEKDDALLVQEDGRPVGVLTRADLLTFIAAFR